MRFNDGEYGWDIPSNLTASTLYRINISDASNPLIYDYSDFFEIKTLKAQDNTLILIILISIIGAGAIAVTMFVSIKKHKPSGK
ncbi:MAG: Ser-Thr-rich GPI-anchored membrane family protein [Candidatus Thorarchaeota archaeon]